MGSWLGTSVGGNVGEALGGNVGREVGSNVGRIDGVADGAAVGRRLGMGDGFLVATFVTSELSSTSSVVLRLLARVVAKDVLVSESFTETAY